MRVYLVVRYHKKEDNPLVISVYADKHKAKAKALELDNTIPEEKRHDKWHGIQKYDVVEWACPAHECPNC